MSSAEGLEKRSRGRPPVRPDAETLQMIYKAARGEFVANSYASTAMEAVASRAGVSTKTLYRLVPTKADLFQGMVADRIDQFLSNVAADVANETDPTEVLTILLIDSASLSLDPEVIALYRLVSAESDRLPEIAEAFYRGGVQRAPLAIATWLAEQCRRGILVLDDPRAAAGMILGMMISEPHRAAMLKQGKPLSAKALRQRASTCAKLFLEGCRVKPQA